MKKEIERINFNYKDWDVSLPTISAFNFCNEELIKFIESTSPFPLIFDTNIVRTCNTSCNYCSTFGGQSDLRYNHNNLYPFLNDENLKRVIPKLVEVGIKTIFLCSNGEPLIDIKKFISLAEIAHSVGLKVITYTNGSTLTKRNLLKLLSLDVNLVIKLESLKPKINDKIICNTDKTLDKKSFRYKYGKIYGKSIPVNILNALEIYDGHYDKLGIETMITNDNISEILDIREWIHTNLLISQFLKKTYSLGYVKLYGLSIKPNKEDEDNLSLAIEKLDSKLGFKYPHFNTLDNYSFDVRRLLNNMKNINGTALRMFSHEIGGVYHSSQIVSKKFGFDGDYQIPIKINNNKVEIENYYEEIQKIIQNG